MYQNGEALQMVLRDVYGIPQIIYGKTLLPLDSLLQSLLGRYETKQLKYECRLPQIVHLVLNQLDNGYKIRSWFRSVPVIIF